MDDINRDEVINYIDLNAVSGLYEIYEKKSSEFIQGGYSDYLKCHIRFRLFRHDFKRLVWNLVVKRIWKKPYIDAFNEYMPPAFYSHDENIPPTFYDAIKDMKSHVEDIRQLKFEDRRSYALLYEILYYRLTSDKTVLFENIELPEKIYFDEDITRHFRDDWYKCILDCGAYDGDTLKSILKRKYQYEKIYCFEANTQNYRKLASYASKIRNVKCNNEAVGNDNMSVSTMLDGVGSRIAHGGDRNTESVRMIRIDDAIDEQITFIKMDIEGEEMNALKGAMNHIQKDKPVLAISLYHKLEDIYAIPKFISQINDGYRFMLRKYGETISELVLYAF